MAGSDSSVSDAALQALRTCSAALGADPLLVQAGGGNTSLKLGDRLHVKASGTWLSDALDNDIFTVLDLDAARAIAAAGGEDFTLAKCDPHGLKPSIETAMHALMPHRCVMHAHPVAVIAATLSGQPIDVPGAARVPYCKPGQPLATAVTDALAGGDVSVLVLENHGLVVGGDTPEAVLSVLRAVTDGLAGAGRPLAQDAGDRRPMPELPGYSVLEHPLAAAIAGCGWASQALAAGALIPDQVVYLGGPVPVLSSPADLPGLEADWIAGRGTAPGLVTLAGASLYVRDGLGAGAMAMARMLADLAPHLPEGAPPRTLTLADELELLNWDAEAHRQAIDRQRQGALAP